MKNTKSKQTPPSIRVVGKTPWGERVEAQLDHIKVTKLENIGKGVAEITVIGYCTTLKIDGVEKVRDKK